MGRIRYRWGPRIAFNSVDENIWSHAPGTKSQDLKIEVNGCQTQQEYIQYLDHVINEVGTIGAQREVEGWRQICPFLMSTLSTMSGSHSTSCSSSAVSANALDSCRMLWRINYHCRAHGLDAPEQTRSRGATTNKGLHTQCVLSLHTFSRNVISLPMMRSFTFAAPLHTGGIHMNANI